MYQPYKKFPKMSLIIAVVTALLMIGSVIFYVKGDHEQNYFMAILAVMVLSFPICVAALVKGVQGCLAWLKNRNINKSGTDVVCRIVDCKTCRYKHYRRDIVSYSLTLKSVSSGGETTYTTNYEFSQAEYEYLSQLDEIRCRCSNGLLTVTEPIPETIYKDETNKETSKFMRVFTRILQITVCIGIAAMFAGIFLTVLLEESLYLFIGLGCLLIPSAIISFIYVIYFFVSGK